jgi:DNA-binding response OmpR family regulator
VLLVEPDAHCARLVTLALRRHGLTVIERAADAEAALALLSCWQPSLIIVELNLPFEIGLAFVGAVRSRASLKHVGVLAATTLVEPGCMRLALAAGCTAWLLKPFSLRDFDSTVAGLLACRDGDASRS